MARIVLITRYKTSLALLWLMMALSSIVFIEPSPYDLLGIALLFAFFGLGLRIPRGIGVAIFLLGVFLLANLIASMLAPDPLSTLRPLSIRFYMVASWLLFTCLIYEDPERVLPVLWSGYIIAAIIAVTIGIMGYYKLIPFSGQLVEFGRVRALFKDPNVYGPFLVPVAIYTIARLESASGLQKYQWLGLLLLMLAGILLSYSRGCWFDFSLSFLLYFLIRFNSRPEAKLKRRLLLQGGALVIIASLLLGWLVTTGGVLDMVEKRSKFQYYDLQAGSGRFDRQKAILEKSLVYPLGIGAGESDKPFYFKKAPHNIYLHVIIESGWLGALAYFGFVGLTVWKSFRFVFQPSSIQAVYTATFACIIGLMAQSLFIDSTHWRHMYLLFAMLWGPLLAWQTDMRQRGLIGGGLHGQYSR